MFSEIKKMNEYKQNLNAISEKTEAVCVELYAYLAEEAPVISQVLIGLVADQFQNEGFESNYPDLDVTAEEILKGSPVSMSLSWAMITAVCLFAAGELELIEQYEKKEVMDDNETHEVHVSFEKMVPLNEYVSVFSMKPYLL